MSKAISLSEVRKTYPRSLNSRAFEALRGVSLEVDEGEVFGFIGPNGAGKSTSIKIIIGITPPTSGSVTLFSMSSREPASRRRVGYVPENPSLYDYLTPLELLYMNMALHGLRVPNIRAHCMKWLERFGLAGAANRTVRTFSKGMSQRTALASAFCIQPRLLLLDEPLSGLDPVGRKEVVDLLAEYRAGGGTIFFSSHVLHDVERLADRFGLIHQGELLTLRSPQELAESMADAFTISFQAERPIVEAAQATRQSQYQITARQSEVPALLQAIDQGGGKLLDVKHQASLEAVFFEVIKRSDTR